MEKQEQNLQFIINLNQITPEQHTLDTFMIFYNLIEERIQASVSLPNLEKLLTPIHHIRKPKYLGAVSKHIRQRNFQINFLQNSNNMKLSHYMRFQKVIYKAKNMHGLISSFSNKPLNYYNSMLHLQGNINHKFHLPNVNLDFSTPKDVIQNDSSRYISTATILSKMAYTLLDEHFDLLPIIFSDELIEYDLSTEIPSQSDLLDILFPFNVQTQIQGNPCLESYFHLHLN